MNNIRLLIATLLCLSLLPAVSQAGTESGLYIGAGVGQSSVGDITVDDTEFSFDGDDTAFKAFAGYNFGWIPLVDLAVEGGYVDFGGPDEDGVKIDATGWDIFGLLGVNLGPVGIFAKAGLIAWDADVSEGPFSESDDGTDPAYGVGARLKFWSLEARAEYEYFDVENVDDVSLLSASVVWTF